MPEINLQQLYNEIQEKKSQRKMIKDSLKDHYDNSPTWQKIKEEVETARAKKRGYDLEVREAYAKDFDEMGRLGDEIRADEELLSEISFQELMKNNKVEITDQYGNEYLPTIKVVFRKNK